MGATPPVERFRCPGCSADMGFDPAAGKLKCAYCGWEQEVAGEGGAGVEENPIERVDPARMGKLAEGALEVVCTGCGSAVQFEPPEVAGTCPFCAAKIVAQPKAADPLITPDGVLPFKVARAEASRRVKEWLASRWFAPGLLVALAREEGIAGVYVPFWTYDAETESDYRGQRGDYYYETEYFTANDAQGRPVRQSRQVRRTRWRAAGGRVRNSFDDVLVAATRSIDRGRLKELEPWDLTEVKKYEAGYLAGFKAQHYQVELEEGFAEAKREMESVIRASVHRDIGGDEQRIHSLKTRYWGVTFKHLLLPVWIGAYRYKGKVYQVTVNARTGEVQGERPWSAPKIALAVAAAILVVVILVLLGNR